MCGDLHLENFGSYKGDNGLVYFDISDFDEAALAPLSWDLVRFLTSVLVAARDMNATGPQARSLAKSFIEAYAKALATGKALWVERDTAQGLIKELLDKVRKRTRRELLRDGPSASAGKRRIDVNGGHALEAGGRRSQAHRAVDPRSSRARKTSRVSTRCSTSSGVWPAPAAWGSSAG